MGISKRGYQDYLEALDDVRAGKLTVEEAVEKIRKEYGEEYAGVARRALSDIKPLPKKK